MKMPACLGRNILAVTLSFLAVASGPAQNAPTNAPAEADQAWKEVLRASQPPLPPADWGGKPTPEQLEAFRAEKGRQAGIAADKAKDFFTRHPDHAKAAEARKKYQDLLRWATTYGETNRLADLQKIETDRLKDPNLSEDERFKLRHQMIQRALANKRSEGPAEYFAELEKSGRELIKEFPKREEGYQYLSSAAKGGNEVKARALAKEILASHAGDEIKADARGLLRKLDAVGKPVDFKFTALD